jgi:transcriptional regulator with XRE-family HTH domain
MTTEATNAANDSVHEGQHVRTHTARPVLLGNRLIFALNQRGLSIKEAAGRIGMDKSQLTKIIEGEVDPRWTTVSRICLALDIPIEDLAEPRKEDVAHSHT